MLLNWRRQCRPTEAGWVFPSHVNGQPYHASPIQQDYIRPAGCSLVRCPKCGAAPAASCHDAAGKTVGHHDERWAAAGSLGRVGWHTFRHTYRSWLDAAGAPMGVQQKLMRHAQISTTMNIYGNAMMASKREANSKVVRMALRLDPIGPKNQPEARHRMRRRAAAGSA